MMLKLKTSLLLLLMSAVVTLKAQTGRYRFKRDVTGVSTTWHSLQLPSQLLKHVEPGFEDLRIFGVSGKDTVEVPYLLKQRADQITSTEVDFKLINQSTIDNGYYFTFQSPGSNVINEINLRFKQTNFDWKVVLEGSNDNNKWFTILGDYRILSIKNKDTDYRFTMLNFPDSKYQYFRVSFKSAVRPDLLSAKIARTDTIKGIYQPITHQSLGIKNDTETKQSVVEVRLEDLVPISYLKINAESSFDFYRSFKIEYATDSFSSDRGIQYNYTVLYTGILTSLEKPEFHFENTAARRLRITIENNDNKPLKINSVQLKGNIYEAIARFDDPAFSYALYYGNEKVSAPNYEISQFESKIPSGLTALMVGEETNNPAYSIKTGKPLFENKVWLWALMGLIILILGWFSFKMLKN